MLKLNSLTNVNASVLGLGIIYGKENSSLQSNILSAISGEELKIWGSGTNQLSLINI